MSQMGPLHTVMCNMYQTRLVALEKAVLDIKSFRDLAKHSSESIPVLNRPEAIAVHAMKGVPGRTSDRSSARRP